MPAVRHPGLDHTAIGSLLIGKAEAIKTADEVDLDILMKEKIALEKFRSSLAKDSGRVSVG